MISAPLAVSKHHRGMTLIEVLVSLVVVSVGLLGIAALQLTTLKGNQEAYGRSQASVLAAEMLDRIRANQAGFKADEYTVAMNGTGTAGTTAGNDLAAWQQLIDTQLPGGAATAGGAIARTAGTNIVTITIQWSERADAATNRDLATTVQFSTRTEI
jgi:type IV pilus assembly protein PilV